MSKEAMKLALEALEMYCEHGAILRPLEARDAIKEALAKQEHVAEPHKGEPVGFCKVLTMNDVADIIVNAQSRTPPYEINYMTVMQLTEKAVLEKFK